MTFEEFQDTTLAQIEALEERRTIAIRHNRFNVALVTSTLINTHRSPESEPVSPFDFLSGFELDPEEEEKQKLRKSVKKAVAVALLEMKGADRETILAEVECMAERMAENGIEDPRGLIREVFPDL